MVFVLLVVKINLFSQQYTKSYLCHVRAIKIVEIVEPD